MLTISLNAHKNRRVQIYLVFKMKLISVFAVSIFLCSFGLLAEESMYAPQVEVPKVIPGYLPQERPHRISLDIAGAAIGSYELRYEYALLSYLTLQVPVYAQAFAFAPWIPKVIRPETGAFLQFADLVVTTGVGAKFNWAGFYVQPTFRMGPARFDYKGRIGTRYALAVEPYLAIGYQNVFDNGVYLDVGLSGGSRFYQPHIAKNATFRSGLVLALGYAF